MAQTMEDYREFTKPAELHKAINTLRGIVAGITTDRAVTKEEMQELVHWCELHVHLRDRHPFSELLPVVESAISDGVITDDESQDILWLCGNFADNASYYNQVTSSIQFLAGMVHGIMADGELTDSEISALKAWMVANDFLTGTYPYDEIYTLLRAILADKVITNDEREQLLAFFSNIIEFKDSLNLVESDYSDLKKKYNVCGLCASDPEIKIRDHTFCFTGEFYRGSRSDLEGKVAELGGCSRTSVSSKTDYLVVGNAGNPCWAYACYGRKIEAAMKLRKEGGKVVIVNETDFWDAIDDFEAGICD